MTLHGDLVAQATIVVASVFALALAFGAIVQRTNFCTMGSVADIVSFGDWKRASVAAAIAVAILVPTCCLVTGVLGNRRQLLHVAALCATRVCLGGLCLDSGWCDRGLWFKSLVRAGGGSLKPSWC